MHIATPNSTFRPGDEEGDGERDVEGDFSLRLSLPRFVTTGVTATAIPAGADVLLTTGAGAAILITGPLLALTTLPEYGLWRATG